MNDDEFFGYHKSSHNAELALHMQKILSLYAPELLNDPKYVRCMMGGATLARVASHLLIHPNAAALLRGLADGRKSDIIKGLLCIAVDQESSFDVWEILVEMGATWDERGDGDAVARCRNVEQLRRVAELGHDVNRVSAANVVSMCLTKDDYYTLRTIGVDFDGPTGVMMRHAFHYGHVPGAVARYSNRRVVDCCGRGVAYLLRTRHHTVSSALSALGYYDQSENQRRRAYAAIRILVLCCTDEWPCRTLLPISGIGQGRDGDHAVKRTIAQFIYEFKLIKGTGTRASPSSP